MNASDLPYGVTCGLDMSVLSLFMAEMPCMGDARVLHEGGPTIKVLHGAWATAMNASDPEGLRVAWVSVM